MKASILIIEKDSEFAQFIKKILIDENYEAVISKSDLAALVKLENKVFNLIISNYYMPNIRGDEFYTKLLEMQPDIPILFISHEADKEVIKDILTLPKADYMVKPIVIPEFLARVETAVEEKSKQNKNNKIRVKDLMLDLETYKAKRANKTIELSPTEFSLLKYLMENKGRVLTRGMLLNRIWGYDSEVTSRVVDVYIGYLRDKIDTGFKEKLIQTTRGFGYKID